MKKRLAIYPFFEELIPLLRHRHRIVEFEIKYAIIPKGWELLDNYIEKYGELICTEDKLNSKHFIHSIDAILLCKPLFKIDISLYDDIIAIAEQYGKEIITVPEMEEAISNLHYIQSSIIKSEWINSAKNSAIKSIDVPLIMVLGFGERCEKWDIQLELSDFFHKKGYRVSLISSNPLSQLMGDHILPSTLDSLDLSFSEQVQSINDFMKEDRVRREARCNHFRCTRGNYEV